MKRRTFLQVGLAGGVLLAAGGGLSLWPSLERFAPREPLAVFNPREFAIFAALAARVVTAAGADPVAITHAVDQTLAGAAAEIPRDIKRLLGLLESALVGLLLDGRPRPFTHLDPAGQEQALCRFRDSRITVRRVGYQALRRLCLAAHYDSQASWASIRYPGPPIINLPPDYKAPD